MKRASSQIIILLWLIHLGAARTLAPWEVEQSVRKNRTARDVSCNLGQYVHEGICCRNCPAGTYVKKHCTDPLNEGTCEECDYDTYTEHDSGLDRCLPCAKCPPDQVASKACTRTSNTECQCKEGYFCLPHHACEVCKKCSKCKADEFEKKQCTPTSNTICEKKTPVNTTVIVGVVFVILLSTLGVIAFYFRKTWLHQLRDALRRKNPHRRNLEENVGVTEDKAVMKEPVHRTLKQLVGSGATEDEDTGLGESLPNTATSSQASLSMLPPPTHPPLSCSNSGNSSSGNSSSNAAPPNPLTQPLLRVVEHTSGIPRLVPLQGEESLRKSFDLFEEVDVTIHKRFFRHLGLTDNDIRIVEVSEPDDKMYGLLRTWMEREGMKASINDLIDALLYLDQRLSAENIIDRAVETGLYKCE